MHDLRPQTALGDATPQCDRIGGFQIEEMANIALTSVAARQGQEAPCADALHAFLGAKAPDIAWAVFADPVSAFWMATDQWMLFAPFETHEDLAKMAKDKLGKTASVTEQTDAWVIFDVTGDAVSDLFERLCPAPVRQMRKGCTQRTTIEHLGCFVLCRDPGHRITVFGPRSAAGSLHHALVTAAHSVV